MGWWWVLIAIYLLGFAFVFFINANLNGMITLPLCLLRALLWPLWLLTGHPHGSLLPMD